MPTPAAAPREPLLAAQKHSLELIVSGAPLDRVLAQLASTVEALSGGETVASIMFLDADGRLRNGAAPSLPQHYLAAIDGIPANPGVGTCAAAAARNEVIVTPDFTAADSWNGLAHLPTALGFKGAWSRPIRARDGTVLGTFGTYFREVRGPSEYEREVVEILSRTAAIAIERARDDAERQAQTRELIEARDAAEAASRAKSQFLAVMSHELRTPLTGIIGFADLLGEQIDGSLTPVQCDMAARIKTGAWHLVSIIDEILTFSRLEAGCEKIVAEQVELCALVDECVELLRPSARASGVTLGATHVAAPLVVTTDPGKARQVVLNLIGNALKFTDEGRVDISAKTNDGRATIVVRDTGCGIPENKHREIFEPFAQVDQSHTRRTGGTGLGLTVSRRLAEMLGGDLELIESEPKVGSTFAFHLPLPDGPAATPLAS